MSLWDRFTPDDMLPDVFAVTPAYCAARGIRAVVFDIDNTLAPYEEAEPSEKLAAHLHALSEAGISLALVSNNKPERVAVFNRSLGLFASPDASKPRREALSGVLAHFAPAAGREVLLVGDQLFTDVLCARKNGVRAVTVPPIQPRENLFFKCKRALEKPLVRRYRRLREKEMKKTENAKGK